MSMTETIERKLLDVEPMHLEIVNESANHNVPAGSESHFKVTVVSPRFETLKRIARHRLIHELLADELASTVHALALHLYTASEWQERFEDVPMSPPCLGGVARENSLPS